MSNYTSNWAGGNAVERVLSRITYKPNWQFTIYQGALQVRLHTPDSDNPSNEQLIDHRFPLPYVDMLNEEKALKFVQHCVWSVERHEMREFFKLDGRAVDPPAHGPDATWAGLYG